MQNTVDYNRGIMCLQWSQHFEKEMDIEADGSKKIRYRGFFSFLLSTLVFFWLGFYPWTWP